MSAVIRRCLLLIAAASLALLATGHPAQARCVTVGADGISNTVCDLP